MSVSLCSLRSRLVLLLLAALVPALGLVFYSAKVNQPEEVWASIALIALLIPAVAWLAASRLVLRPVDALVAATRKLKEGELQTRTGLPHGPGELGQLAAVFDELGKTLQRREEEQRRAQEHIQTLNRALTVFSTCNQAVIRATEEDALLDAVCQIIVRDGGYRFAWVGFAEPDEARTVRPVAQAGFEEGYLASAKITWADSERGHGPVGVAIRTGEMLAVRNILEDPAFAPWLQEAKQRGYASVLGLPLRVAGKAFGALAIYSAKPDAFDSREIELLTEMANDLSFGIVALRTQEERNRAEAALRLTQYSVDHSGDLVAWATRDARFVHVNETACRRLGYSREEMLARKVYDLDTTVSPASWPEQWERVKQRGSLFVESLLRTRNGEQFPVELSISHVNFGGKEYRCTFARDITARKEADKQLRLQGRTLEAAANAIVITDRDGIMVWVNPAFTRLTGYTAEEMVGQNPRTLQSGQHDRSFYENLWKTILSGCVWRGEVVNRRKDGSLYTEEMTITPVLSTEGSISHFIAVKEDISARKRAEEELRRAEEKYRHIFENAVIGIFQTTPDGRYLSLNPKLAHMYGNSSPEERMAEVTDIGRQAYVNPSVREEFKRRVEEQGEVSGFEYQVYRKDGGKMWLLENARAVRDSNGKTLYYEGTVEDITEHKQLEDQFRQAQKMEAVGRLAGGVAHDMNNMLGVIIGYSELLRERFDPADPLARQLGEVKKAADRAASLTRQLLAFSRKQVLEPRILDLNGVVENLSKLLRRLIGEDVELVIKPHATPVLVKVDPGQMEQVLMNLAINARDAMPRGGKLVIETTPVHLDETYARQHVPVEPGSYVLLSVSDSGCGMNAKVLPHVFEPFFTTKEVGKGTGLGLSTVYGIVKQSGGYIWVYSEPDQGTTFKIYLPQASTTASPEIPQGEAAAAQARGSGTILLVEDEEALREVAQISLQSAGYTVLVAADGPTALEMARQHKGSVDLLLTDVIMPRMSGREVAEAVATERKNMKVLYMSGFTDDLVAQHGLLKAGVVLLQKPFTLTALLGKVREVLKATAPEGLPEPPSKKSRMSRAKRQGSGS